MNTNDIKYVDNRIVIEYTAGELDSEIANLEAKIAKLQTVLDSLEAVKASIV